MYLLFNISYCLFTDIPDIVLQPVGTTVHVGAGKVEIRCSSVGHSKITYHWERYNFNNSEWSSLTKDGQTDINDVSMYRLINIAKNDEGMYRCAATNIDGSGYSDNATIIVYGKSILYVYIDISLMWPPKDVKYTIGLLTQWTYKKGFVMHTNF